jgi:hypothetical protein
MNHGRTVHLKRLKKILNKFAPPIKAENLNRTKKWSYWQMQEIKRKFVLRKHKNLIAEFVERKNTNQWIVGNLIGIKIKGQRAEWNQWQLGPRF